MTDNFREKYSKVFIPFIDVYELSGVEVFSRFSRDNDDNGKNLIVIPMNFIERLDEFKDKSNSVGAIDVLRFLKHAHKNNYSFSDGKTICEVSDGLDIAFLDSPIIQKDDFSISNLEDVVNENWTASDGRATIITNKEKYHIKYGSRGLRIEDPEFLQVSADIVHEGIIDGNDKLLAKLYQNKGPLALDQVINILGRELYPHQFIRFVGKKGYDYARVEGDIIRNKSESRILRFENPRLRIFPQDEKKFDLRVGNHHRDDILGISPRDMEQYLSMQYGLLNEDVSLFFLTGAQGSGKTLLSFACAVDQILWYDKEIRAKRLQKNNPKLKAGFYKNIVLLKPNEIMGGKRRDVGALPGSLYSKIKPHLGPYLDSHRESILHESFPFEEMLRHPRFSNDFGEKRRDCGNSKINNEARLPGDFEAIEMTYSGFMRGRSFTNTLILVDEAQNFSPYEVKTILERMGEGCKGIIMGDPLQVDNPFCSREINGMTHAIRHYLDKPYSALINLGRNYRSQVSADAQDWKVFSS